MAQQGLFTQGPSIDDLLEKRNTRASTLQRQLMQQASQGAARPMETQAASLIGSSLGRALAGAMDGGSTREKLEAEQAKQSQAQGQYLEAAQGGSQEMFDQVAILQKTYPAAAVKMLALAKEAKKEEDAAAAAVAQATADAEDAQRVQNLAKQKIIDDKAALVKKYEVEAQVRKEARIEQLRKEGVEKAAAEAQATAEAERNKVVVMSGAEYNAANGTELSEDSMWTVKKSGALEQIDKPTGKSNVTVNVPAGMNPVFDKHGNIIELIPIKNGPQWLAAQALEAAEAEAQARDDVSEDADERQEGTINWSIDEALRIADLDSLTTPIFGKLNLGKLAGTVEGSERSNLEAAMEPIMADAAFDTLADMRAASKTGGALGAINTAELNLLKASRGSLQLSQGKEEFVANLKRYQIMFNDGMHGSRKAVDRYNKRNPTKVPLVYWGDAKAAAEAKGKASQAEVNATGTVPSAASMSAAVAKYY